LADEKVLLYFESFFAQQVCFEKIINVQFSIHVNKIKFTWI